MARLLCMALVMALALPFVIGQAGKCTGSDDRIPNPKNCRKYFDCLTGERKACEKGVCFDPATNECEPKDTVDCNTDSQIDPEGLIGKLLTGNSPGARDIVFVLDNSVDPVIFPYYKAFISNIVGKLCGDIGDKPQDIRVDVASVNERAFNKHSFTDVQSREVIQDRILRILGSSSRINLEPGAVYARGVLTNGQSGSRSYARKEAVIVTSEPVDCNMNFQGAVEKLKTTAATVYFIVIGKETAQEKLPEDPCALFC